MQVFDLILSGLYGRYCYVQNKCERDSSKVEKIMKKMNISNLSKKYFSYLSDGEKQISLIARALIKSPDILVLDEPIANLDYKSKFFVVDKINELTKLNTKIFCVTHDISTITKIYDRVIMLKDGRLIADGPQNKVINNENLNRLYGIDVEVTKNNGLWNIKRLSK
jgi:iron complex transport system ATP-binding protein